MPDPTRQGRRIGQDRTLAGHHPGRKSAVRRRRLVAREQVELGTERATQVAPKPRLSLRRLEEELVEHRILVARHQRWFFLTADYAFGQALERDTSAAVEANGGKVLGRVRHPLNTNECSTLSRASFRSACVALISRLTCASNM